MCKRFTAIFFSLFYFQVTAQIKTPVQSPAAAVQQQIGLATVSVAYGRPSLKGRKIIGTAQVPYGKIWRMGANKATVLSVSDTVQIAGHTINPGSYLIAAVPSKNEWIIILNKNYQQWGTYSYNITEDVLRFSVQPRKLVHTADMLSFEFTDVKQTSAILLMLWENIQIGFTIIHHADAKIKAEISRKLLHVPKDSISAQTLYDAANYYYHNDYNLPQAFEWANRLAILEPFYWRLIVKANIALKLKLYDVAASVAAEGKAQAEKDGDDAYIVNFGEILKQCKKAVVYK